MPALSPTPCWPPARIVPRRSKIGASGDDPDKSTRLLPSPWTVSASRYSFRDRWLAVRSDSCVAADGTAIDPYHIVELPDWVNVVALTPSRDIVLVREYRHGTAEIALELPSGTIDPGEAPLATAQRELREETGYGGGLWHRTGRNGANPARQNNHVTTFLALDVELISAPKPEPGEVMEVLIMPLAALFAGLADGSSQFHGQHLGSLFNALLPALTGGDTVGAAIGMWRARQNIPSPAPREREGPA
jgi:ADP-ribose pyrophosphatase